MVKKKKYLIPFGVALSSIPFTGWQSSLKDTNSATNPTATNTPDDDSVVCSLLSHQTVYNNDFVRNTFYTWTTKEQIDELRKQPTLLTRSQTKKGELSLFDLALRDTSFNKYPIAKVLSQDKFKNKRFGWTNAWAIAMGWQKEQYGDQLLKITLKDDAIIGSFNQNNKEHPFAFFDMQGDSLPIDFAIKNQDKIAVMYHISNRKFKRTAPKYGKRYNSTTRHWNKFKFQEVYAEFREYVIMNEAMIKSWSYGAQDISAELNSEIAILKSLSALMKGDGWKQRAYFADEVDMAWSVKEMGYVYRYSYSNMFRSATCIENDYYLLAPERINAIVERLQKNLKAQGQPISSK